MINLEDFKKLDIRVALIEQAEKVEGSDKLLRLSVDDGEGERQILSGIAQYYSPEDLIGRRVVIMANLEPREIMGLESKGMLLAADDEEMGPVLLMPEKDVRAGSSVK